MTGLPEEERNQLAQDFDDLVAKMPRTDVATARLRKALPKMGAEIDQAVEGIVVDIGVAYVRQKMGL